MGIVENVGSREVRFEVHSANRLSKFSQAMGRMDWRVVQSAVDRLSVSGAELLQRGSFMYLGGGVVA
jgi:hypothetical protein